MSYYKEKYATDESDFPMIPAGIYPVKVLRADVGPWSAKNQDLRWSLELEITGDKFAGQHLWHRVGMNEKARPFRRGTLTALGVDWQGKEIDLIDDVVGLRALAEVFIDPDFGVKVKRLRTDKTKTREQVSPGQTKIEEAWPPEDDSCPF